MPGWRAEHGRVGACEHRQAEPARDDRGVRAGAAADGDGAGEVPLVQEADQLGGVDIGPDQDERGLRGRCRGRVARQPGVDRGGHLADVARPLREVRVGQCLEDRGLRLGRRRDRGGGGRQREAPGTGGNRFRGCLVAAGGRSARPRERVERGRGERRVGGHERADLHDARLVVASRLAEPAGERVPLGGDPGEGGAHLVGRYGHRLGACPGCRLARQVKLTGRRPLGNWRSPVGGHGAPGPASPAATSRRAPRISTVEAAPGSS